MRFAVLAVLISSSAFADDPAIKARCDLSRVYGHPTYSDDGPPQEPVKRCAWYAHELAEVQAEIAERRATGKWCFWRNEEDAMKDHYIGVLNNLTGEVKSCQQDAERSRLQTVRQSLLADARVQLASLSAAVCVYKGWKQDALEDVKRAKKAAKIAGVVDLRELYDLQAQVIKYDGFVKAYEREIRDGAAKPISCSDEFVKLVGICEANFSDLTAGACSDQRVREIASLNPVVP